MAEFTSSDLPFAYDPAATAAFARLRSEVGEEVLHDTAAPVKAVVIGGGTGAPVSIRTLLSLEAEVSAVVAMADDGGSTGILREEAGVLPPGDIRKCLAAMAADDSDPLTRAFKYRFSFARNHTLGNLMLSALEDATGSFPEAIAICGRLLGARGRVYPSTLEKVVLCAEACDGVFLGGQARACKSKTALHRAWLESDQPIRAYEPALDAIRQADLIVLGPGSLFTSIIPNLLVPGVIDAIRESRGATMFVCSLADMQGETWGLSAKEHYEALARHGMDGLVDYMLVHSPEPLRPARRLDRMAAALRRVPETLPARSEQEASAIRPVRISYEDACAIQQSGPVVLVRNLVDPLRPTWHDPNALRDAMRTVVRLSRMRLRK
ncbi:gluconeogenesis factor YvcK family protein [Slackia sp.]|uniref:gluconeogenesis factor YvcK family protein n=1 Tax=Slackia sp. TaxID=2049041 RepID=UPI002634CAF3|nr:gluconeogenesis factor YvcK family protein [Slackia sp.]MEE0518697.1 gluconeogenesis factor YvcK family protein [Slackia sp.]